MRKIVSFLLIFLMLFSLVGCSGSKVNAVVEDYCKALKNYELDTLYTYMLDGEKPLENDIDLGALTNETFDKFLRQNASKLTYTVGEGVEINDRVQVSVVFKYADASAIMQAVLGEYFTQALALAFSGASDEAVEDLMFNIFKEKIAVLETTESTETITFNCKKVDNEWKIVDFSEEDAEKLTNVMTCNIVEVLNSFDDSMNDSENQEDASTEEWVYSDVAVGKVAELATLTMKVKNSYETDKLSAEYMDDEVAQKGTKFIVVELEIENITKDRINYSNELYLVDDKEREYSSYSDALWYFDETFTYTELQPNIPVVGHIVYNVPEDSQNCFFVVGKAGTNQGFRLFID